MEAAGSSPATPTILRQAQDWSQVFKHTCTIKSFLCLVNLEMFFVYILNCEDKSYYVGYTDNLSRRLHQHRNKENTYTKKFTKIDLVYYEEYNKKQDAKDREIQLKGWTKEKKKVLIDGNINKLKKLSNTKS